MSTHVIKSPEAGLEAFQTRGLLSLSPELILEIVSNIISWKDFRAARRDPTLLSRSIKNSSLAAEQTDLANLRLVCRSFSQILEVDIFRSLTFDFHVTRVSEAHVESRLALLARGGTAASKYAMFLSIKCLDPAQEGYGPEGTYFSMRYESDDNNFPVKTHSISVARDTYLEKAILSLQNLRCVAFNIDEIEDHTIQAIGALSALPSLEDLTLRIGPLCEDPSRLGLFKFHDLRSLAISLVNHPRYYTPNFPDERHQAVVDHLAQIISQSPKLSHLSILQPARSRYDLSFKKLVKKIPATQSRHHLETLHLALPDLVLDDAAALRYLMELRSLRIDGSAIDGSTHPLCTGADIWGPLAAAQIKLQEITVSHLSAPLLSYLNSYSGLKKLQVLLNYYPHGAATLGDMNVFFKEVLPLHGLSPAINPTLPRVTDGLLFERDVQTQVPSAKVSSWPITVCMDCVPDALPLVLESVTQTPECRTERLNLTYSSTMMYFGCGTGMMQHFRSSSAAGLKWLTDLSVTNVERYPSVISISTNHSELRLTEVEPGMYHYRPVDHGVGTSSEMDYYYDSD